MPPGAQGAETGSQRAAREGAVRSGRLTPGADRPAQPSREPSYLVAIPCLDTEAVPSCVNREPGHVLEEPRVLETPDW